jgi:hypothetical protein
MIENKSIIYTAKGNSLESVFLEMSRFINKKYIQGEKDVSPIFKQRVKTI